MTNLRDLSKHLGLSITQVSRALNGYPDVSQSTRQRVEEAAKALNYQPNLSARKLARGRSGMVALVRRHYQEITRDPTFLHVATGLSLEFAKREMQLVLHVSPRDQDPVDVHKKLYAGGAIDGFVILEPHIDDPRIAYLEENEIPFVVHGRGELKPEYAFFDVDNVGVGYQLAKHLIEKGHHRILLINGFGDRGYSAHREIGFKHALEEAGIEFKPSMIVNARMTEATGERIAHERILEAKERPTAVICAHIRIAKGVYQTLQNAGLHIPNDISLVAHDDMIEELPAEGFSPPLTVTRAAIQDSWVPLSEFMQRSIDGEEVSKLQEIEPVETILGESSSTLGE